MKIRIELTDNLTEDEIIIRCGQVDENIQKIHQYLLDQSSVNSKIIFYKQNMEFYFPLSDIYFFETENEHIYAHTANDSYKIKYRLYELEQILPKYFFRVSKSAIVNIKHIYSIERNITSSSLIQFANSYKTAYVSRQNYRELRLRLNERSYYEK
ncbi:MAG: LytTR family DNA-binding domain-containing protein [Bacillota bacterium]|nr:LytTR family DNA-binding domain-containing protein [Bacillota bacterium]